jgi:hypothetical protein
LFPPFTLGSTDFASNGTGYRNNYKRQNAPKAGSDDQEAQEIEEALDALRTLRKTFKEADQADRRELLSTIISRIDLEFDQEQRGKYIRSKFRAGSIHLRPDRRLSSLLTTGGPISRGKMTNC